MINKIVGDMPSSFTAPAVRFALIFCAGIFLQLFLLCPIWVIALLLLCTLVLIALYHSCPISEYFFILCILLSGMLRCAMAEQQFQEKWEIPERDTALDITVLRQKTTPYYIASYTVEAEIDNQRCRGTMYAKANMPVLIPGKSYHVSSVRLKRITSNVNPYDFNYLEYAKGKGITHSFNVGSKAVIKETAIELPMRYAAYYIRTQIAVRFLSVLGIEKGSLVNGLLLGMKSEIPDCISNMFRQLGISHLLAVSGLHVGLIVLIVYQLLLSLSLPRIPRTLLICVFLIFYCYLTGGSPSVIRSSLMTALVLLAPVFQRRYHALNAVAATAVILLLINPFYLRDVGFQFSFSAVCGILIGYQILKNMVSFTPRNRAVRYAYDMLLVSASAALFTAPIALFYFNTFQLASLMLNIIAIPLTFCVMICAMLSIPCLYFPSFFSDIVLHALDMGICAFRGVLRLASMSGIWTLSISSYWKPCIIGAVLICILCVCIHNKRIKYIFCILLALFSSLWFYFSTRPEWVQLSLKRGQAIVFRNGQDALIINTGTVGFNYNDYDASIKALCEHWGIRRVTIIITAWEKTKKGTVQYIRQDFPGCQVLIPEIHEPIEADYKIITRDTSWAMGKQHILIHPESESLSLIIRTKKDSICIHGGAEDHFPHMNTDVQVEKVRHGIIIASVLYQKE